jgi:hypothetical protein
MLQGGHLNGFEEMIDDLIFSQKSSHQSSYHALDK